MYLLVGMGGGLERKLFDTPPPAHCIMLSDEQGGGLERTFRSSPLLSCIKAKLGPDTVSFLVSSSCQPLFT